MTLKKWIDLATYYNQVHTMFNGIFLFMGLIVFLMVLMASINTLLMAMLERIREIGTMLAMGTPRSWIVALLHARSNATRYPWRRHRRRRWQSARLAPQCCGPAHAATPGYTVNIPFRVLHVPALMIGSSIMVVISLALASILPAIRASRLQIAEALAHV